MKKHVYTALIVTLLALTACQKGESKKTYTYDRTYFNGLCALSGEFNSGVDYALTNEWTKEKAQALNAKSMRIWIAMSGLFSVGENDELIVNQKYYSVMRDHVDQIKAAGVENFLIMYTSYVYPYGYNPSTGYVVPDPYEEYESYVRFLNLQKEASKRIKEMFPEIRNFEPGNEPDFACPGCIHKNGFIFGGDMTVNYNYVYNDDDKACILLDLCWYVRQGIREVDENARVVFPGLTNQATVPDFLDLVYKKVASKRLPVNQEKSDTDPDNYFDVLNWHPYPNKFDEEYKIRWDEWIKYNKSVYQVVIDNNDEGKEVYFSEIGWTDYGSRDEAVLNEIANNYTKAYNYTIEELPFVTGFFAFRLTNLIYQVIDETGGEENFGLFYHPNDPLTPAKPKPAAYAVAKAFNGEDYDLDAHL